MNVDITFAGCVNCYMDVMNQEGLKYRPEIDITFAVDLTKTRHDSRVLHTKDCEFINRETRVLYHLTEPVDSPDSEPNVRTSLT
jgi:hypothetical protein